MLQYNMGNQYCELFKKKKHHNCLIKFYKAQSMKQAHMLNRSGAYATKETQKTPSCLHTDISDKSFSVNTPCMNNYISFAIHSSHSESIPAGSPEQIQYWVITFGIAEEQEAYFIYLILVWPSGCSTERNNSHFPHQN